MALEMYRCAAAVAPYLLADDTVVPLPTSKAEAIETPTREI
jgi:hypothetical protein